MDMDKSVIIGSMQNSAVHAKHAEQCSTCRTVQYMQNMQNMQNIQYIQNMPQYIIGVGGQSGGLYISAKILCQS